MKPLLAGNWKMNGLSADVAEFDRMTTGVSERLADAVDVVVCPPVTLLGRFAERAAGSAVRVGGQTCHEAMSGAHTGDISAAMLRDCGAAFVIVGHSERRAEHGETDAMVEAQARAAMAAGLTAIICVGETADQRRAGATLDVVARQIDGSVPADCGIPQLVVAYEPVWAIGTGLTPTAADIAEVHALIRARLVARLGAEAAKVRILYGGSVKPSNAAELLNVAEVGGALVGGACLKAADFLAIASTYLDKP